jgi:membrane-bound lytic murein transglycosylase B
MTSTRQVRWLAALVACAVAGGLLGPAAASALDTSRPEVRSFIDDLVKKDGFDAAYLEGVFAGVETKPAVVDSTSKPAERVKQWFEYRPIFLTARRISAGIDFYREHEPALKRISKSTGVPPEILVAILGVETSYGTRTGGFRVVDSLSTLAFEYPPRATFFRGELRQLFLLAREERLPVTELMGSYAGALGPPQFMPSSYRAYAVDGDKDGRRNLMNDWDDILASIANYFVAHDWQPGQPIATRASLVRAAARPDDQNELTIRDTVGSLARQGVQFTTDLPATAPAILVSLEGDEGDEYWVGFQNFYAITRYNRSVMYALAVFQLGQAISEGVRAQELAARPQAPAP